MSGVVDQFYEAIRSGDTPTLDAIIGEDFCLICPTQNHVLSGVYEGKRRFFDEVMPHVFGCVSPEEITFCQAHEVFIDTGAVVVAMAQNGGLARSGERYDQIYLHVFKVRAGKIVALIECFDTALANRALWGDCDPLMADTPASLSNLDRFHSA